MRRGKVGGEYVVEGEYWQGEQGPQKRRGFSQSYLRNFAQKKNWGGARGGITMNLDEK